MFIWDNPRILTRIRHKHLALVWTHLGPFPDVILSNLLWSLFQILFRADFADVLVDLKWKLYSVYYYTNNFAAKNHQKNRQTSNSLCNIEYVWAWTFANLFDIKSALGDFGRFSFRAFPLIPKNYF